jgi:MFS family permease
MTSRDRSVLTPSASRQKLLFLYFFIFGLCGSSWIVRLPEVRSLLDLSTAGLGWLLVSGSVGALAALLNSGRYISRFGARHAIGLGFGLLTVSMIIMGAGVIAGSLPVVIAGALISGAAFGLGDVGINVEGADLEKRAQRSLLPQLHGAYSLGTFAGAGVGTLCGALLVDLFWQQTVLAVALALVVSASLRFLPRNTGVSGAESPSKRASASSARPQSRTRLTSRLLFLGIGILGVTLAEGAANDWLTIAVVDDFNLSATVAGITFACAMTGMVVVRFTAGRAIDRWGRVVALRASAIVGVVGVLAVIFAPTIYVAWVGAAMWGAGVALGFPLFISASADGENSSGRVAVVSTFGYISFLVGPPLLGFLGESWGVLNMFFVVAGLLVLSVVFAGAAKPLAAKPVLGDRRSWRRRTR